MRGVRGFTLIELLVVIAIIAMLLAILVPGLKRVKEQDKRIVCLSNLRQMMICWEMYAEDNDDKIVNGNTGAGGWVQWLVPPVTEQVRIQAIENGLLFPYCSSIDIYKCPTGMRDELVTYAIMDRMNGYDAIPGARKILKKKSEITSPGRRAVFVDEGRLSPASWTVWYDQERWWDQITARHGNGTDFSFADTATANTGSGATSVHWRFVTPTSAIGKARCAMALSPLSPAMSTSTGSRLAHGAN